MSTLYHLEDLLKVVTARGHHQFMHWEEFALTCHRGIRVGLLKISRYAASDNATKTSTPKL
ncbi:hypothetical protein E2C01_017981 [Portunus trituberculatus]|uniref:Uncharacterized protein n=1 Tax=Portunus trituberculatus TaxID=210409 RepID=A0A5B7DV98_PORTR|nr:hypothetical protein [Portunus trituberculatus]